MQDIGSSEKENNSVTKWRMNGWIIPWRDEQASKWTYKKKSSN